jgi:uncharacterized protein YlxP (DUF503 family)
MTELDPRESGAYVGVLIATFHIPGSHSLKDRRRVIRSIKDRTRHKFNASVAEVGELDLHQRATLGVAVVGNEHAFVENVLHEILRVFRRARDAAVIDHDLRVL